MKRGPLFQATVLLAASWLVPAIAAQSVATRSYLPDLYVDAVALDEDGFLVIQLANVGEGALPDAAGDLQIFVDGAVQGTVPLEELGQLVPRAPGATASIRTRLRLSGEHRRVAIVVDPENVVEEENEYRNVFSFTADASRVEAPEVVVDEVGFSESGLLYFTMTNTGAVAVPADVRFRGRVFLNDTVMVSDFILQTQGLGAAQANRVVVFPTPPVVRSPGTQRQLYRVQVRSLDVLVDHTRAELRRRFGDDLSDRYEQLLGNERIAQALVWQDAAGARSYGRWSAAMKAALASALAAREENPTRVSARSIACGGRALDADEARRIYLAHVAYALWLEVRADVSWRLPRLDEDGLRRLLDSRWLLSYREGIDQYTLDGGRVPAMLSCDPFVVHEWLQAVLPGLREHVEYQWRPRHLEPDRTIYGLADWLRAYVTLDESTAVSTTVAAAEPRLTETLFPQVRRRFTFRNTSSVRALYVGLLRGLNVAVDESLGPRTMRFLLGAGSDLALSDVGLLFDPVSEPSGDSVATARMFASSDSVDALVGRPEISCNAGRCNNEAEQRQFNTRSFAIRKLLTALPDSILRVRCTEPPEQFEEMLVGVYALPFLTSRDRAAVAADAEARLMSEGAGDRMAGCMRVERRWRRYQANR